MCDPLNSPSYRGERFHEDQIILHSLPDSQHTSCEPVRVFCARAFPYTGNAKADPRNAPILTTGPLWRRWYATGGKEGAEPPPEMKRIVEIVDKARTVGPDEQVKLSQELYRIWADNLFEIGTVGLTPMVQGVVVTNTRFQNVPKTLGNDWPLRSPGNDRTEQFYFAK